MRGPSGRVLSSCRQRATGAFGFYWRGAALVRHAPLQNGRVTKPKRCQVVVAQLSLAQPPMLVTLWWKAIAASWQYARRGTNRNMSHLSAALHGLMAALRHSTPLMNLTACAVHNTIGHCA